MKKFIVIRLKAVVFILMVGILIAAAAGSYYIRHIDRYPKLYAVNTIEKDVGTKKTVYLTFDDGPSAITEKILDILDRENIKATFFVIGPEGEKTDERLLKIYEKGHTIGIHSWSHDYNKIYSSTDHFLEDFNDECQWIYDVTGEYPSIFRFPGGSGNSCADKEVMREIKDEMSRRGFVWYDWNADGEDSIHSYISAGEIAENVFRCENKDEIVVLLHDSSTKRTTPEAVELIISKYKAEGYSFGVLTDMKKPIKQNT